MTFSLRALGCLGLSLIASIAAAEPQRAFTDDDIAWGQCAAFADGKELPATPQASIAAALNLGDLARWSTGPAASESRHFRLVFTRPIEVGTICSAAEFVAVLRDDAASPGDVLDENAWRTLATTNVRPLAAGTKVRAIRITVKRHNLPWENPRTASVFPGLYGFRERFFDPSELGYRGWNRPVAAKGAKPELQWLGYWPEPLPIAAVVFDRPIGAVTKRLPAETKAHPRATAENAWQTLNQPTRAVRVQLAAEKDPPQVFVLSPLTADAPPSLIPPAPVALNYEMPLDGFAAIRIEDASGRHVRRLIAEVERGRGAVREDWDLLDDQGRPVPPGDYKFVGVARPPFKLTYEMTVYNAGNPPWLAPVPGGGWWMADHAPPCSACVVGEYVFFGAAGAEFGTPLIATDRDGKKVWHDLHQGAQRLTSDGRFAYVVNDDEVVRIDPQNNFAKQSLHKFQYNAKVPGHAKGWLAGDHSGCAVFGDILVVSYSAPAAPWIRSAFRGDQVDIRLCRPSSLPRKVHVTDLTPDEHIHSTFQTSNSSLHGSFGPAEKKGPLKECLLLTLKDEVAVGSVVVPSGELEVYALREGAKLPGEFIRSAAPSDPTEITKPSAVDDLEESLNGRFDEKVWQRLKAPSGKAPGIAVDERGGKTKALLFRGEKLDRIDYGLVLDRRYRDAALSATMIALEGDVTREGAWKFNRAVENPLSYGKPAVAGCVWKEPIQTRGFMLTRPTPWAGFAVDMWTGPADATIDAAAFAANENWREVHLHRQVRNDIKWSWHTPRVVSGDFGAAVTTRAMRVRVIDPPQGPGAKAGPTIGGFEKLLVFEPLGNDAETPVDFAQRLTVLDLPTAKVRGHLPLSHPTALTFDREGRLLVACEEGVCRLPALTAAGVAAREVILPPKVAGEPRALTFDAAGLLWSIDGECGLVRAFDLAAGKCVREFGAAPKLGVYDLKELSAPAAFAIDGEKLWIVEQHFQPKRITRRSLTGEVEKELYGPTHYGGGGMLDPRDKSVINHLGMKFRIDYATRTWKLESRLASYGGGSFLPDRVTYVDGKRFLIGDRPVVTPFGDAGPTAVICEEVNGEAAPRVAAGLLGDWRELPKNPALQKAAEQFDPSKTVFVWSDRNADRAVQVDEVRLLANLPPRAPHIGDDLSLNFPDARGGSRLRLGKLLTANGAAIPDYTDAKIESLAELTAESMVTPAGETFVMNHKLLNDRGERLWTYRDRYIGVQASNMTPWGFLGRPAGEVAGSIGPVGHFQIGEETIFCVGGNNGDYYAFTRDGLLAGCIVGGPKGYGRRYFSLPECEPGKTDLSDLRKTVEDFHGHVTRAEDGNVYAIVGKNHVSLVRVDGFEKLTRFGGKVTVTAGDVAKSQTWVARRTQIERFLDEEGPKKFVVPFAAKKIEINGDILTDWPAGEPLTIRQTLSATGAVAEQWQARLAFDKEYLYVGGTAIDSSPLANSADDPQTLFQFGDALDLHLGLDPQAPADRTDAAAGDVRLLLTFRGEQATAMLYRYVTKPGADPQRAFQSPVGETAVAEIRELKDARLAVVRSDKRWTLEAAIPWKALGVPAPTKAIILRGDLGALESDPNGRTTVARHYWANKKQVFVGDQPAEARVLPATWGEFEFQAANELDSLLDLNLK